MIYANFTAGDTPAALWFLTRTFDFPPPAALARESAFLLLFDVGYAIRHDISTGMDGSPNDSWQLFNIQSYDQSPQHFNFRQ